MNAYLLKACVIFAGNDEMEQERFHQAVAAIEQRLRNACTRGESQAAVKLDFLLAKQLKEYYSSPALGFQCKITNLDTGPGEGEIATLVLTW